MSNTSHAAPPESLNLLKKQLRDPDEFQRLAAIHALFRLDLPEADAPLIEALNDSDSGVREAAALALGERGAILALPALRGRLNDPHPLVWAAAMDALVLLDDRDSVPQALAGLNAEAAEKRAASAGAIGAFQVAEALPTCRKLISDPDPDVRIAAAQALGDLKDGEAVPLLQQALKDETSAVCSTAAWALGEIGDPSAIPDLLKALDNLGSEVRIQAATALALLKAEAAASPLQALLQDLIVDVRGTAVWALGEIQSPSGLNALISTFADPDPDVQGQVYESLLNWADTDPEPVIAALRAHQAEVQPQIQAGIAACLAALDLPA